MIPFAISSLVHKLIRSILLNYQNTWGFLENLFLYFYFTDYAKVFDYVDHNKLWKILQEIRIPDHFTFLRNLYEQKSEISKLEPHMEQRTGSKFGKEYIKAVYCHLAYLTYMQSTSCEIPGWIKHKLKSRLPGEISITSDTQMIPPYGRKWRGTKESLEESERGEWKGWLKMAFKKQRSWHPVPSLHGKLLRKKQWQIFFFGGS